MRTKVLILGANGMAGHAITLGLRNHENFEIKSVARSSSLIQIDVNLDLTDFQSLKSLIFSFAPHVVINCAGILNEKAEEQPAQAILINAYLPRFLEEITSSTTIKIIHISTDCVFSGLKGDYNESDNKDGLGIYATTKALGELENSKDLTIRTSIIGPELKDSGTGLFNWFSKQDDVVKGYTNAFWSGITTMELTSAIKYILEEDITGLYHLVSKAKICKNDLLQIFNSTFNTSVNRIIPFKDYYVDKSLINNREDLGFDVKNYPELIDEMFLWISEHRDIYPHYNHLIQ